MFFSGLSCEQTYLRDFKLINEIETQQLWNCVLSTLGGILTVLCTFEMGFKAALKPALGHQYLFNICIEQISINVFKLKLI